MGGNAAHAEVSLPLWRGCVVLGSRFARGVAANPGQERERRTWRLRCRSLRGGGSRLARRLAGRRAGCRLGTRRVFHLVPLGVVRVGAEAFVRAGIRAGMPTRFGERAGRQG